MTRILIVDGHPDPDRARFVHALADAYAAGAGPRHDVRRIDVGSIDFPLIRSQQEWMEGAPAAPILEAQQAFGWAEHLVFVFPLWLGDMPAVLKGFLEQVARPGFALRYGPRFPEKLLRGRSARIVVTMGMPAAFYRLVYRAHAVRSFERNILNFVGIKPVRTTLIGSAGGQARRRAQWLEQMRRLGTEGA